LIQRRDFVTFRDAVKEKIEEPIHLVTLVSKMNDTVDWQNVYINGLSNNTILAQRAPGFVAMAVIPYVHHRLGSGMRASKLNIYAISLTAKKVRS
jgi:hypothetical protein